MKPTRAQYLFVRGRPVQLIFLVLFVGGPLFFAAMVTILLVRAYQPLSDVWNLVRVVFLAGVALVLENLESTGAPDRGSLSQLPTP